MLERLFGSATPVRELKDGLDESSHVVRGIAHRVSNAATPADGFRQVLDGVRTGDPAAEEIELEREMVALANEQIRFDASAGMLQRIYQQVRTGIRGN